MNSTKIAFGVALIAFCCITFSYTLKCYTCDSKDSCKKPKLNECNPLLANNTRAYLDAYHTGVNMNMTSPYFECFREYLKVATGEYYYRGCTYQNIQGCNLALRDYLMINKYERDCNQCSQRDGCNPADRANINIKTVFATIVIAFTVRYVRQ